MSRQIVSSKPRDGSTINVLHLGGWSLLLVELGERMLPAYNTLSASCSQGMLPCLSSLTGEWAFIRDALGQKSPHPFHPSCCPTHPGVRNVVGSDQTHHGVHFLPA